VFSSATNTFVKHLNRNSEHFEQPYSPLYTGWLKIKYPTRQYATSRLILKMLVKLLNSDNSVNIMVYSVSTAP